MERENRPEWHLVFPGSSFARRCAPRAAVLVSLEKNFAFIHCRRAHRNLYRLFACKACEKSKDGGESGFGRGRSFGDAEQALGSFWCG